VIGEPAQVGGIALLKVRVRQAFGLGAPGSGLDQVPRDVDTEDLGAAPRFRQRRRAVAAAEIQHFHARRNAEAIYERVSAFAHGCRDAREVALLPHGLIRIRIHLPSFPVDA